MTEQRPSTEATAQELVITREFDAPRALVFKAWTEPERLMRWWGPADFTAPAATIDFRVGGKYLFCMRGPDGKDYWSTGTYQEIVEPERIVCTDSFADADGNVVSPTAYGMGADFPDQQRITITFEEVAGRTRMTLHHAGMPKGEMREMAEMGWNQSFDKLAASLARA